MKIEKNTVINTGNFKVHIGTHNISDVAIVSNRTGEFVPIIRQKVSKKLRAIKRTFKANLNSEETFTFSFMTEENTLKLIDILKR